MQDREEASLCGMGRLLQEGGEEGNRGMAEAGEGQVQGGSQRPQGWEGFLFMGRWEKGLPGYQGAFVKQLNTPSVLVVC